jgi:hypothetical protein
MLSAKDLITEHNVWKTYNEGKYIIFVLKNGVKVKIDPNSNIGGDVNKNNKEEGK